MKLIACRLLAAALLAACSSPSENAFERLAKNVATVNPFTLNTGKTLYASTDFGLSWTPAGGNLPDDANIEVMEKMGAQFVLATEKYGLFIGHPDRPEWKRVGQALPNQKITALHVTDREMYVGVYEAGIFVSRDQGAGWQSLNAGLADLSVRSILKIGEELLVGTNTGLFRSEQGQTAWKKIFTEGQVTSLKTGGGKIAGGTNRGIIFSEDDGQSWRWILKKGAVHNVAILDGQLVSMDISGDLRFFREQGSFWETVNYFPREYSYIYEMIRAGDYLIFSNNYGVHRSEDGGKHWELVFPNEETVFSDFLTDGQTVYAGTKGWNERRGK